MFGRPLAIAILVLAWPAIAGAQSTMTLDLDASQAPMKLLHASLSMPARPGTMTLFYPKWIPGEHMPSGPISNLTGLHVFADDKEVEWRRDLVEMHAFRVTVPPAAHTVRVALDYSVPTGGGAWGSAPSANAKCAVVNWYTVMLYPMGVDPDTITVKTTLKVPAGWKQGGSLDVERTDGDVVRYAPTSVAMLNDHPVVLGENLTTFALWPAGSDVGEHAIDVIADSRWALQFPPALVDGFKRLVKEERRVFGDVGHYRKYHWLLTLSDNLGGGGVEHHETADDRVPENTFVDPTAAKRGSGLLAHEFFHSWNGKARRPTGLMNGGYEKPMLDGLLWIYEGLTNYYGELLAARAGLMSTAEWMDVLAADAMDVSKPGRTWRPLQDTADAAPFLYTSGGGWVGWRRAVDFYSEGSLIWLEADVTIRRLSGGKKTLDDFCALFHGQKDNGRVYVKPYDAAEVYATLNEVAAYDWKGFFDKRLTSKGAELPLGGVEGGGYRLVYTDVANGFTDPSPPDNGLNALGSLGIHVAADGTVDNALPERHAFAAGLSNGMKIVAVNGRRFSVDELRRALAATKDKPAPLELMVENSGYFKVVKVDYQGGLRYPHLERVADKDDVLAKIAEARVK